MKLPAFTTSFGVFALLILSSAAVVLYSQGYRLNLSKGAVEMTGILLVKSIPEGAKVYLDGKLITATNSPISDLGAGTYHLKIEKEGYFSWEKDVSVKEGFVTDITALLPPLSPSLTAMTHTGARLVTPAPSGTKVLFISGSVETPASLTPTEGSWVSPAAEEEAGLGNVELYLLNLTSPPLGFLRGAPSATLLHTLPPEALAKGGETTELIWSPNEDQALIIVDKRSYLVPVSARGGPTPVQDVPELLERWSTAVTKQRAALIPNPASLTPEGKGLAEEKSQETPPRNISEVKSSDTSEVGELAGVGEGNVLGSEELTGLALKPETLWSPDECKFLYEKTVEGKRQFWVVDLSKLLPVGDKRHQMVWETSSENLKFFWLADSRHFIMLENDTISLLDLDGSNKRDLFSGTLSEPIALSTADLTKIIILATLNPKAPPNLYAISLR